MNVIGTTDSWIAQRARIGRLIQQMTPLRFALLAATVAGWLYLGWVLRSGSFLVANWTTALVAMLTVLTLGFPRWLDALSAQERRLDLKILAHHKLISTLKPFLDSQWTLFQLMVLPDDGPELDALLVGPGGLYLLDIKMYSRTYQNSGREWLRRLPDESWESVRHNPTDALLEKEAQLTKWLQAHGWTVAVQPRLVWAGSGLILPEEPDVPFWLLNQPQAIQDEVRRGQGAISAESLPQLNGQLAGLISTSSSYNLLAVAHDVG